MDPALRELIADEEADPDHEVEAIIRLRRPGAAPPGVRLVAEFGHVATCRLPLSAIRRVWAHPNVLSLKAPRGVGPADLGEPPPAPITHAAVALRPTDLRRPRSLTLTGEGTVVGIADWGLDVDHADLRHADGRTRLLALWDQRDVATGRAPDPYKYGAVHSTHAIDAALRSGRPFEELGYHPAVADRTGTGAHGTHVAGIAVGNGLAGGPAGVAPRADLVFVHLADRGTGGRANLGDSVRLLEAVHFISRVAGRRPWVVNLSLGRGGGPHDGSTGVELGLDEYLQAAPGRFVVQSAGNYHDARAHAKGVVGPDSAHLDFTTDPEDPTTNELEVWYDAKDEFLVKVWPPGQRRPTTVSLGAQADLTKDAAVVGRVYHRALDPNGDHHVDAFLYPAAPSGRWRVVLEPVRVADGRFHAWIERDDAGQTRFSPECSSSSTTTGTIANGRVPLVVGAYSPHGPGLEVYARSSAGPTRDERPKPDVSAPGFQILAARSAPAGRDRSRGLLVRKSGTSMAAPFVTGAVALALQGSAPGDVTARELRELVLRTARPLNRGENPLRLGHGRIDLAALEAEVLRRHPRRPLHRPTEELDMDQLTDPISRLQAAPAQAFRELVYRPGGPLAGWLVDHFEVVATRGQAARDTARAGDVLLTVALGRPGVGTCAVLDRAAGPARLAPGQVLLRRRDPSGRCSDCRSGFHSDNSDAEDPPIPAHVACARRVWNRLMNHPGHRSHRSLMAKVALLDLADLPSKAVRTIPDLAAWTNSARSVFVGASPCSEIFWEALLEHELLHVQQFESKGRPTSYAAMMRFECDAYTESVAWCQRQANRALDTDERMTLDGLRRQFQKNATKLCDEITRAISARLSRDKLNARYGKFLVDHEFLPKHTDLGELYLQKAAGPSSAADLGDDAEDDPYVTTLAKIRAELTLRFTDPDDPGLLDRRKRLRTLFAQVPADRTRELHDQLGAHRTDNALSRLFHGRLATATRRELLGILVRRFPQQTRQPTPAPVFVDPHGPLPSTEKSRLDAAVASLQAKIATSGDPRAWRYRCWLTKLAAGADDRVVPWFRICPTTTGAIGAAFVIGPCDIGAGQAVDQTELQAAIRSLADVEVANQRLRFFTHLRSELVWTVELTSDQFHLENFRRFHDQVQLTQRNLELWANNPMGGSSAMPKAYRSIMAWIRAQQANPQSIYSCM